MEEDQQLFAYFKQQLENAIDHAKTTIDKNSQEEITFIEMQKAELDLMNNNLENSRKEFSYLENYMKEKNTSVFDLCTEITTKTGTIEKQRAILSVSNSYIHAYIILTSLLFVYFVIGFNIGS